MIGDEYPPASSLRIDAHLARTLVDAQFPQWAQLQIAPVSVGGVDNRTFRLGQDLSVRLPSGDWYALQVAKEQRWLPVLAPQLPLPIPQPVAQGDPGLGYPYPWSVYGWLDGEPASARSIADLCEFARTLAGFLNGLKRADPTGGPAPGRHNYYRGGPLSRYADEAYAAVAALKSEIDRDGVLSALDDALAAPMPPEPVWFHGDVAAGNLLLRDGRLGGVIDFGTSGVGDPSCDVVIAWTLLGPPSRQVFRQTLGVDAATWARGRGWALWKALITLAADLETRPDAAGTSRRVIERVLGDGAADR